MYEKLPQELKERGAFCLWRYEQRNGDTTKVPYQTNGLRGDSTSRAAFTDYTSAVSHTEGYDGIGIGVFDDICAIDIDHCVENGTLSDLAKDIIARMDSYTECSAYDLPVANREKRTQNIKGRCPESEENMNHKFYCGSNPAFTDADREDFSRGGYECKVLMKDGKGQPVAISQNTDPDFPVWKVEYGYSCMIFATYDEAMAFCKGRFSK